MTGPDTAHCENEHGEPRWAVALLHLVESTSAANATALCQWCLSEWMEAWLDEQARGGAEAYELRPLAPVACRECNSEGFRLTDGLCDGCKAHLDAACDTTRRTT